MRANAGIVIIILLLLVGIVGAVGIPDTVIVTTNKPWIIANNIDQSTITVTVLNTTPGADSGVVSGVQVILAVNDTYGTLTPGTVTTDASGKASSNFKVKTKSGAPDIFANISSLAVSGSGIQNIDHDSPYYSYFSHPLTGEVDSQIQFNISMSDRWGNPVDDKKEIALGLPLHLPTLHISGPTPNDCFFVDNGKQEISPAQDFQGNWYIGVNLTNKTGNNYILMDQFGSIGEKLESILAVATSEPYSMTGTISPEGALLANNIDYFTLNYYINDSYGNRLYNKSIWVNTTLNGNDEQVLKRSNSLGQIQLKYGPKSTVNYITITAISTDNQSVSSVLHAEFIDAGMNDLVLIISPQILMSRELPNSSPALVYGMLTGLNGYPIQGENITFEILSITNNPPGVKTGDPSFSSTATVLKVDATTDNNGIASATLYPGSFNSSYNSTASGSCYVQATWNSQPAKNPNILVEWKNYPYLSVQVDATPQTVRVNDTITFNITVTGNGYKMVQHPIAVMLDLDTSSSLHSVSAGDKKPLGNDLPRFENEKLVSQDFVRSLNASTQVGLVTYGFYPNNQFWQLINDVSLNHVQLNASIGALIESGGLNVSIRESVHEAVTQITNRTRPPEEVGAIVMIGDSAYNNDAADLAAMVQETWTDNKIRIYSIQYVSSLSNCLDGKNYHDQLKALTDATHGRYYCNNTRENILLALADIKQNLTDIAGANATMELSFENVPVNSTPMSGGEVFEYIPETKITWPNGTVTYENQSGEWTPPDYQLHFNIGTIKIGEVWRTEYRLKLKTNQTGLIDLFASNSKIKFNDGSELNLPAIFLTAVSDLASTGSQSGTLVVSDLKVTKSGNFTDYVPLQWNLYYQGINSTTETMCYCLDPSCASDHGPCDGLWIPFDTRTGITSGNYTQIEQMDVMDVKKFPSGSYWVKVHAFAPDAPDDDKITGPIMIGNFGVYIKLT